MKTMPWDDCKVAFKINDPDKIECEWELWNGGMFDQLPAGWQMNGISTKVNAGEYCVTQEFAIFKVEVALRREDGEAVAKILAHIERPDQ